MVSDARNALDGERPGGDGAPAHVAPDARVMRKERATRIRGGPSHDCAGDGVWLDPADADALASPVPNPTLAPRSVGAMR